METHFIKCSFEDIKPLLQKYTLTLSSPIDSFLEEHILESQHYLITLEDKKIGCFSIHKGSLITLFYMDNEYKRWGQKAFYDIKKMEFVESAFASSCDEFMLSHALDQYKTLEHQAYFFQDSKVTVSDDKIDKDLKVRRAVFQDEKIIENLSGDFFNKNKIEGRIGKGEIYIAEKNGKVLGFGIIEKGMLLKGYASIGMFTVESARQEGVGRNILLYLKDEVYKMGMIPIAGCWYYNHYSKKTLESAGMYSNTRLFRVNY